ncbi:myotubularin-related protein 12 isoform X1 [Rattus norvegicus]|uniref:myotubularin-related protein 12 isoform X1 n=1 Tax=Rattus norvegicus TaxID=10116 RepID=UPI00081022B6|nr:myotubularin-related protein 12 isoform X2 [Rattus norvegicus]|eukprot:XP_017446321.1 PREDICTED: myotubularin-related protein 12 isoform X2 [Rattus norvegicus]
MLGKGGVGGGGGTKAPKPSFVSYVRPEEIHTNEKEVTEKEEVTLHLLPGEQLLCEASTVLKYVQEDSCQLGICGRLVCTDFRISFLGDEGSAVDNGAETHFKNKIIGVNDIPLHCVDQIYGDCQWHNPSYPESQTAEKTVSVFLRSCCAWHRLPAYFVVPTPLLEDDVKRFQGRGIPIWCWSCHNGSALLKMSALPKEQDDSALQIQKSFLDGIYKTIHRPPYEMVKTEDLSSNFLSLQEIQSSYCKFKQLFLIDSSSEFWDTDVKWFSLLESSGWLDIIRRCLKRAIEIIECLEAQNMNVLLLEENASDLCCLLSSLVQVMMDAHCRTWTGFQSLIQKEWVMGGHSFLDRCNHLHQSDKEEVPVFLLFLDCVWQLVHQHPPAFEFTETYLTVLSDSLYIPIFSTFFFNSPHQKDTNMGRESLDAQSKPLTLLTVWDWSVQFEPKAQTLLRNPLYVEKPKLDKGQRKGSRFKHQRQLSLPLTQSKSSPKRGFFREETDHLIKNLLGKRISKLINSSDDLQDNSREFYDNWHSKPTDYHGLLLPHIEGPEIKVWAQRYLRWIPEAQILGGGRVATMGKLLEMMEEVQSLQEKIEARHHRQEAIHVQAPGLLRNSARLSSLFPFAMHQRHSAKPVLPTSGWKALGGEDDLAKREDEFVDLGDV